MEQQYEKMIAEIDRTIAHSGERINGLANNVNRALNVLGTQGSSAQVRDVLLAFEAFCLESMWRSAWLLHARGEHEDARHCLEVGRMLQAAVDQATR